MTDEQWQYITWGAIAVSVVAIVAIGAVAFGLFSGGTQFDVVAVPSATEVLPPSTIALQAMETIDVPVSEPVIIESPRLGPSTRYHRDGAVVVARVTMDECERSEGMLRAGGSIRNESPLGQTLTYALTVDLVRGRRGARLARLDTVVEGIGPGEVAVWGVETPSTKVVTVGCEIATLTVTPLSTP